MILMVLFSIKMVSVASVCVTLPTETLEASAYSSCTDRPVDSSFGLYIDEGLANGDPISYVSTQNYSTLRECTVGCNSSPDCFLFDYNCQTGDCVFYAETGKGSSSDQIFFENGHISGIYF